MEWRTPRRPQHNTGFVDKQDLNGAGRYRRDVRDATKYIETAIIIDKAMFDKRNGSTRAEVVHDAIQVANIADLVRTELFVIHISKYLIEFYFNLTVFSHTKYSGFRGLY